MNCKLVSIASCWEIAIKAGLGKLQLGAASRGFLSREIARNNFELLPVTLDGPHWTPRSSIRASS